MPNNIHAAHARNDEVRERIHTDRRLRSAARWLEGLFDVNINLATKVSR